MTRKEAIKFLSVYLDDEVYSDRCRESHLMAIQALEKEPSKENEKCIWIKYDYRTICPKECGGENPYWRIPENMENLKYCPYCGREIEVQE